MRRKTIHEQAVEAVLREFLPSEIYSYKHQCRYLLNVDFIYDTDKALIYYLNTNDRSLKMLTTQVDVFTGLMIPVIITMMRDKLTKMLTNGDIHQESIGITG